MTYCREIKHTLSGTTQVYACELLHLEPRFGMLRHVIDREYVIRDVRLLPVMLPMPSSGKTGPTRFISGTWTASAKGSITSTSPTTSFFQPNVSSGGIWPWMC